MVISNIGSYANVYESLYASKQTKTSETDGTSAVKNETAKQSSNEEYLKSLQKQVPYIKLHTGYGLNANNDGKVNIVDVSPKLLEKMKNDPEAAKEYTQRLKDVESALKLSDSISKSMGHTVVTSHAYVDEDGHMSYFAYVVFKDELNEKLRKEAQENAEKQIEKTRENARQKAEQLAEKLEEKAEEAREIEENAENIVKEEDTSDLEDTAKGKAEKLLLGKLENAEDGAVYLDEEDMQVIMNAARNAERDTIKSSSEVGENFDLKI